MTRSQRYRSRFGTRDFADTIHKRSGFSIVNRTAHRQLHSHGVLTYTSKATLDTNAGSPIYPSMPIRLIRMSINVKGAPASTLTCDLLLNGNSVFPSGWDKPTISAGNSFVDSVEIIGAPHVLPLSHDYLQIQLTATGSATGPLVAQIEYMLVR